MFRKYLLAAALLGASALSIALAAPLGPQTSVDRDPGLVTPVKGLSNPNAIKNFPKGGNGPTGSGKSHNRWYGVGAAIVIGTSYCAAQVERCDALYGHYSYSYWRCLRRAGCLVD